MGTKCPIDMKPTALERQCEIQCHKLSLYARKLKIDLGKIPFGFAMTLHICF